MKGATTEPFVRTIRPPKMVISTNTGTSQNFFRAIMNAAMSFRNDIIPSERPLQRLRSRAALLARYPVRVPARPSPSHGINAEGAHHQASRHDRDRIHPAEKDRIGDLVQQQAQLHPAAMRAFKHVGLDECRNDQHKPDRNQHAAEQSHLAMPPSADAAEQKRDAADNKAEALVGGRLDRVLARKLFVQFRSHSYNSHLKSMS